MNAPFVAVGIVILLISASVALEWKELEHQINVLDLQIDEFLRLSNKMKASEMDLSNLLREAVYSALQEVCAKADHYPSDEARENFICEIALGHLQSFASWLPLLQGEARILLNPTWVKIEQAENGFVQAKSEINALLSISDAQTRITRFMKEVETLVDCRFYLLQNKMNEFLRRLGEINNRWRDLEYLSAWAQALTGELKLSAQKTAGLFEMAWCDYEAKIFDTFYPPVTTFQLPRFRAPDLSSAVEIMKDVLTKLRSEAPLKEKIGIAKSGLSEVKSILSRGDNSLFCRLRKALVELESQLVGIERLPENEKEEHLQRLLQEGDEEEVDSWIIGENGLERVRIRAPKLEPPTLPSLLRFLMGSRAELSLLYPSAEILSEPQGRFGLSVFREMKISKISFQREDPCGKWGKTATPIYLWFLDATVWWGQYTVTLELENEPLETVVDSKYPTIPTLSPLPAHYPLRYSYRIPRRVFRTRVVIVLPTSFEISQTNTPD